MPFATISGTSLPAILLLTAVLHAGAPPEPDVLILNDGEKLIGHLVSSNGPSVKFKSDALGDLTLQWSKIKEFHSARQFAVIPKDVDARKPEGLKEIVHGQLSMADQKLVIAGPIPMSVPVGESEHVVDEPAFDKAVGGQPGILEGWKGALTGGIALVEATQDSRTFTGSASFVRVSPDDDWLAPRDRTSINLSAAYGDATQPGEPSLMTEIYHADGERDEYFNDRWFGFGRVVFDHNFGQGLDLSQNYGGGIGWTVLKRDNEELDLKGSMSFIRQDLSGVPAENLAGATAAETFNRKFRRGVVFTEQISLIGALNNASAYTAAGNATLAMPLYKRLNFTVSTTDNVLGDPAPGFRKNSLQFVTGVTYSLK
jgi:hypothetical protein